MQFNVCIIGCGDMGRQHAGAWSAREDAKIVAVADPLQDRRESMAQNTGATAYRENLDAIRHPGVNVISICTPVCFHSEIACQAAENGKHILSEKPLALTLEQADAMIQAARDNNVRLVTSLQYRGFPRNVKFRELFREGAFGGPIFARFTDIREVRPKLAMHRRSMNGGPIIDMVAHYFDLLRFVTGEEPVRVYARGHVFGAGKERLAGIEDLAIDAAEVLATWAGGHTLEVFANWGMPEGFPGVADETLAGPNLVARASGSGLELMTRGQAEIWEPKTPTPAGPTVRINDLVAAIKENRAPEVGGEEGRIALSVSLAALESVRTGKVVEL